MPAISHTEKEIADYLDRLDIIDETVAQGFDDQPLHRENFAATISSLQRRKDRLVRRQRELERRDEKVLVFGEPEAKPMGNGLAPKMPSYNLQSVVDVESGLIVHHDVYNDAGDTIRCPAGEMLRPSGRHTRNRAIRYRTPAYASWRLKPQCTPAVQRTIHRLVDQAALDRMEARIYANPSLMTIRRFTVERPFRTIKRMSDGGRFLTRGLRAMKANAALSSLPFNILHAANAFGA